MKCWSLIAVVVVAFVPASAFAQEQACNGETYGTAVAWIKDQGKAVERARSESKLVLVVHLSGELDDAGRT